MRFIVVIDGPMVGFNAEAPSLRVYPPAFNAHVAPIYILQLNSDMGHCPRGQRTI